MLISLVGGGVTSAIGHGSKKIETAGRAGDRKHTREKDIPIGGTGRLMDQSCAQRDWVTCCL